MRIVFTFLLLSLSLAVFSQDYYIRAGYNRHFSVFEDNYSLYSIYSYSSKDTTYETYDQHLTRLSLGKGQSPLFVFGFKLSGRLSLELGVDHYIGSDAEAKVKDVYNYRGIESSVYYTETYKLKSTNFYGGLVFSYVLSNLDIYIRTGLLYGRPKMTKNEHQYVYDALSVGFDPFFEIESNWEYYGPGAIGFSSGLGIEYYLSTGLSVFADINYRTYTYTPEGAKRVSYTFDGYDELENLSTQDKEVIFVDHYSEDINNNTDLKLRQLKQTWFVNSVHLGAGLAIHF